MRGIKRSQLVNMNQHYRRFSMDFFLDCQQRLGIGQIELGVRRRPLLAGSHRL
ncbi:MAG: hypothetical protein ACLT5P_07550 [Flavonifractor plautii]